MGFMLMNCEMPYQSKTSRQSQISYVSYYKLNSLLYKDLQLNRYLSPFYILELIVLSIFYISKFSQIIYLSSRFSKNFKYSVSIIISTLFLLLFNILYSTNNNINISVIYTCLSINDKLSMTDNTLSAYRSILLNLLNYIASYKLNPPFFYTY